jgi:hypothetical protein
LKPKLKWSDIVANKYIRRSPQNGNVKSTLANATTDEVSVSFNNEEPVSAKDKKSGFG